MSCENGISLTTALNKASSSSEKKKLIRNFGRFLQHLHEEKTFEVFREDRDWLEIQLEKAQQYVENEQTEGSVKLLNQLKVNRPKPVQQTMIHGDCTTDNILIINEKDFLFIDVAGMTIGDPRYDESLAIRTFIHNQEYLQAFYEGYNRYRVSEKEFKYFDEGLYEFKILYFFFLVRITIFYKNYVLKIYNGEAACSLLFFSFMHSWFYIF
ncbi:hypothetical protein J6TS2_38290 [Heyndrickxia sporothermodurans]|nr:hypothetical protein J6TS2_38290 [Heyndrickxia sporothermodurans]